MGFLTGIEIRRRIEAGSIEIRSLDANEPFSPDGQITEDCIDLRLAPTGLKLKEDIDYIDYLHHDLDQAYESVEIPAEGYTIAPLEPLITQTLEAVCFPDDLIGLVVTRSTFARMGLITTCMAPKFAIGIRWAFPLQIVNISRVPLRIYPYAPVAQLLISDITGEPIGYRGKFQDTYIPTPPRVSARERESLSNLNANAVNRTFHIINRDNATREKAPAERPTSVPQLTAPPVVRRLSWVKRSLVATLGVLAAFGFGICGNLVAGGRISYWQGVSIVLLAILSVSSSVAAFLLQAYWPIPSQVVGLPDDGAVHSQ
jgi:deoxycytidine triphosphate deaminase